MRNLVAINGIYASDVVVEQAVVAVVLVVVIGRPAKVRTHIPQQKISGFTYYLQ
jgi:hypothetical protein